jgi:hypothetical protein
MKQKRFEVINHGYPLHVHAADCPDLHKGKNARVEKGYVISGFTVQDAVKEETASLNEQFDRPYSEAELFRVFPCCHKGEKTNG